MKKIPNDPFYICDPEKATTCKKTNCYLNGGKCKLTLDPKRSKNKLKIREEKK